MKFSYNNTDGNNTNRSAFNRCFGFTCYDFKSMKYWETKKQIEEEENNRALYEFGLSAVNFSNSYDLSNLRGMSKGKN